MINKILKSIFTRKVLFENTSPTLEESINKSLALLKKQISISSFLEIGSRDGFDAERVSKLLNIPPKNIYIIEANPDCYIKIKKQFPLYKVLNYAIYKTEGILYFNKVYKDNIGTSSLFNREDNFYEDKSEKIEVQSITGKTAMQKLNIREIDFCKIDVEGATYEVIESFGDEIKKIKLLHIECEHRAVWQSQKLYPEIKEKLIENGFQQIYFEYVSSAGLQSDSIWVLKELM